MAIQAPDGIHYLSEGEDGSVLLTATTIGPDERFVITRHDPSVAGGHCCGHRRAILSDQPEPAWEHETHRRIVSKARELMKPWGQHFPEARHAVEILENPAVWEFLLKGLHDADEEHRYTDIDYSPHFYDPDVRRNFRHPWPGPANPNALSEGARYFHLSTALLADILWKIDQGIEVKPAFYNQCGYVLGLACHYLTDLTQPMHAANFANLVGGTWPIPVILTDWRHSDFEKNADRQVKAGYLDHVPPLPRETFEIPSEARPFDLLHDTAVSAKAVFKELLEKLLPRKLVYENRTWRMIPFTDGEVREVLDRTLKGPSIQAAARFFALWWRIAHRQRTGVVTRGRWYRIKESTKGEYLRATDDNWIHRWAFEANNDDFLHGFARSPRGGWYIVCKSKRGVWTSREVAARPDVNPTQLQQVAGGVDKQRFVPVADGRYVWLFTLHNFEPLRIREGADWDGHVVRWTPDISKPHLFTVEYAGPMTEEEQAAFEHLDDV